MFAYEDGGKGGKDDLPKAIKTAHLLSTLPEDIWQRKYHIVTDMYGFASDTYEAKIVMKEEAFWCFQSPVEFRQWIKPRGEKDESTSSI